MRFLSVRWKSKSEGGVRGVCSTDSRQSLCSSVYHEKRITSIESNSHLTNMCVCFLWLWRRSINQGDPSLLRSPSTHPTCIKLQNRPNPPITNKYSYKASLRYQSCHPDHQAGVGGDDRHHGGVLLPGPVARRLELEALAERGEHDLGLEQREVLAQAVARPVDEGQEGEGLGRVQEAVRLVGQRLRPDVGPGVGFGGWLGGLGRVRIEMRSWLASVHTIVWHPSPNPPPRPSPLTHRWCTPWMRIIMRVPLGTRYCFSPPRRTSRVVSRVTMGTTEYLRRASCGICLCCVLWCVVCGFGFGGRPSGWSIR